ncbi:MAG: hypothetical protein IKW57_01200 [Alphaproteobacteria bacterium]|nr:hypothetical protein [Alphaproteobacteria bacterium]
MPTRTAVNRADNIRGTVSRVFAGRDADSVSRGTVSRTAVSQHKSAVDTARTTTGAVVNRADGTAVASRAISVPDSTVRTDAAVNRSVRSGNTNVASVGTRGSGAGPVARTATRTPVVANDRGTVGRTATRTSGVANDRGVATGGTRRSVASAALTRAAQVSSSTDIVSHLTQTSTLNSSCQERYNECMDQYCAVLDEQMRRCSCSKNLSHYSKVESALQTATNELSDVAQKIRYVGLSADEIRAIMTETIAEQSMKSTSDTSENAHMLSQIADLIISPTGGSSTYYSNTSDMTDLGLNLDFSSDGLNILNLDLLSTGSTNTSISNLRGASLYNAAKKRCNDILKSCGGAGATTQQISAVYDMAIDRDCVQYEQSLNTRNKDLVSSVRSATTILQKARLAVLQNKNQYDARGCVAALDACMQDDMVCGSDYTRCLDPTQRYISADGDVIFGQRITTITDFMKNYNNASITAEMLYNAYDKQTIDVSSCSKDPSSKTNMGGNDGSCIVKYLLQKIGTKQKTTDEGLCRAVLDRCQRYSYNQDVYQPYNDVVVNYIQNALVKIYSAQYKILSDYASECIADVSECYNAQIDQLNTYSTNAIAGSVSRVLRGACRNIALTCAYAVFADAEGQKQCTNEDQCIDSISSIFYQSLMCPLNSTYLTTEYTGNIGNGTEYVSSRCKCNSGYDVWGGSCLTKCPSGVVRDSYGVCGGSNENPNNPGNDDSDDGDDSDGDCTCVPGKSYTVTLHNDNDAGCCPTGGISKTLQTVSAVCQTTPFPAITRAECTTNPMCVLKNYTTQGGTDLYYDINNPSARHYLCSHDTETNLYSHWAEISCSGCTSSSPVTLTLDNTTNAETCCNPGQVSSATTTVSFSCNGYPTLSPASRATCRNNPNCRITGYRDDAGNVWMDGSDGSSNTRWCNSSSTKLYAIWSGEPADICYDGEDITLTLNNTKNAGTCCDASTVDLPTQYLSGVKICNFAPTWGVEHRATCGSNPNCVITGYADDTGTLWMNGTDGSSSQVWTRKSATLYAVWEEPSCTTTIRLLNPDTGCCKSEAGEVVSKKIRCGQALGEVFDTDFQCSSNLLCTYKGFLSKDATRYDKDSIYSEAMGDTLYIRWSEDGKIDATVMFDGKNPDCCPGGLTPDYVHSYGAGIYGASPKNPYLSIGGGNILYCLSNPACQVTHWVTKDEEYVFVKGPRSFMYYFDPQASLQRDFPEDHVTLYPRWSDEEPLCNRTDGKRYTVNVNMTGGAKECCDDWKNATQHTLVTVKASAGQPMPAIERLTCASNPKCQIRGYSAFSGVTQNLVLSDTFYQATGSDMFCMVENPFMVNPDEMRLNAVWSECACGQDYAYYHLELDNVANAGTCCPQDDVSVPTQGFLGSCNRKPTLKPEARAVCTSNPNCVIVGYTDVADGTMYMNNADGSSNTLWCDQSSKKLYAVWAE